MCYVKSLKQKNILLAGYLTKNKQQIVSDLNFFTFNIESSLFEIKGSRQERKNRELSN
jgi:hypothetical protein